MQNTVRQLWDDGQQRRPCCRRRSSTLDGPGPRLLRRFGDAVAYSYDLDALAAHHAQYRRLMRHWHAVMPGAIHDVDYTALVRGTEAATLALLAHCGLPFEAACLDTAGNPAPVATLSSAQVREPIHARALEAWKPYASQLAPLRLALQA